MSSMESVSESYVRSSAVSFVEMDLRTKDARALPPDDIRSCEVERVSISGIVGRSVLIHVFVRGSESMGLEVPLVPTD
jgi:hypothetical protein